MNNIVKMEIVRDGEKLHYIKVFTPTWQHKEKDGKIYIRIPFFGIETYATTEDRIDIAIEESIKCFCMAAEDCGLGLESELEYIGWQKVESDGHLYMDLNMKGPAFDYVLNTGEQHALELELL